MMDKDGMRQSSPIYNAHKFRTTSVFHVKLIQELHRSEQSITIDSEHLTQNSTYLNRSLLLELSDQSSNLQGIGKPDFSEFINKAATWYQASDNFRSEVFCSTRNQIINFTSDQMCNQTLSRQLYAQNLGVLTPSKGSKKVCLSCCGCHCCMHLMNGMQMILLKRFHKQNS